MLGITPLVKFGKKLVCHVISDNTSELIDAGEYVNHKWGIREAGTCNEHLTVNPHQARILARDMDAVQLEQDIKYKRKV